MKKKKMEKIITMVAFIMIMIGVVYFHEGEEGKAENKAGVQISYEITNIPEYHGEIYITINDNHPKFTAEDRKIQEDYYSDLTSKRVRNGYDKNELEESKCR